MVDSDLEAELENGATNHDIGFVILPDSSMTTATSSAASSASSSAPLRNPQLHTPDSKRDTPLPPLAPDASSHRPSSPMASASTIQDYTRSHIGADGDGHIAHYDEVDIENIPPPTFFAHPLTLTPNSKATRNSSRQHSTSNSTSHSHSSASYSNPHSIHSSPSISLSLGNIPSTFASASASHSHSTSSSSRFYNDNDIVSLASGSGSGSGSGVKRQRYREKSKLSEMVIKESSSSGTTSGAGVGVNRRLLHRSRRIVQT
jgi:hypothetical protein